MMNRDERDGKLARAIQHLEHLRREYIKRKDLYDNGPCDSQHERGILQRKRDWIADDIRREENHIEWLKEQEVTE